MSESETEITKEELQKEIAEILNNASLENTSTKKVIQKLENKLGVDLTEKKKLIDQLVMDYVNSMDTDDESEEEELPKAAPKNKKIKKEVEDEDDNDVNDDSNDSDWGWHHDGHLLEGHSGDGYHAVPQEANVATFRMRHHSHNPSDDVGVVLNRTVQTCHEDEANIFGKLTAKKLRKLSDKKRDYMMARISHLFYDKCHKRRIVWVKDKGTSMAPPIQCEPKKLYRLEPTTVAADSPIAIALANLRDTITSTYKASSEAKTSNIPEPMEQVAGARMPIAISLEIANNNETALKNKNKTGGRCVVM